MDANQGREGEELSSILESYAQFMHRHIQKFNLLKYGLDPEDIMQDVRIKIWNFIRSDRTVYSRGAYIKKIIDSSIIDQLRRLRRQDGLFLHEKLKQIAEINRPYDHEKEAARQKALKDSICEGVERLIRSRRQVVKLYLFGFSIQEISSYLGWSVDKTRNLLYRGLADLRKYLRRTEDPHEVRR